MSTPDPQVTDELIDEDLEDPAGGVQYLKLAEPIGDVTAHKHDLQDPSVFKFFRP